MNTARLYWRDCTTSPRFYKDVYWGDFSVAENGRPGIKILFNRDHFIQHSGMIGSRLPSDTEFYRDLRFSTVFGLDHFEFYKSRDGERYQVCSQNPRVLKLTETQMEQEGWKKIPSMYAPEQDTYIRKYDRIKSNIRLDILQCLKTIKNNTESMSYVHEDERSLMNYYNRELSRQNSIIKKLEDKLGYNFSTFIKDDPQVY